LCPYKGAAGSLVAPKRSAAARADKARLHESLVEEYVRVVCHSRFSLQRRNPRVRRDAGLFFPAEESRITRSEAANASLMLSGRLTESYAPSDSEEPVHARIA